MEVLEKIFGSSIKARLMRSFVYNPGTVFDVNFLAKKIKARAGGVKKEINTLEKAGLIRRRPTKNENGRTVNGATLNLNFKFLDPLREFLLKVSPLTDEVLVRKLSLAGRVKLVVVAGIFINEENSRLDMLIVSERPDEKKLKKILSEIESEFAREISYSLMSVEDFKYRLGMGDKLVRDVFDFAHNVIINKIGLTE